MERHVAGVTDDTQRHAGRPIWYYLPIVLAGTWPWMLRRGRVRRRATTDAERLLWGWLLADVVLLSLAGSKLATYLLPALPAVAVLAARRLVRDADAGAPAPRWLSAAGAVTVADPGAGPRLAVGAGAGGVAGRLGTALALAPLGVYVAMVAWGDRVRRQSASWSSPPLRSWRSRSSCAPSWPRGSRPSSLALDVNAAGAVPARVWIVDEGVGSFVFYLREDLRRGLQAQQVQRISRFSTPELLREPGDGVLAVASDRVDGLAAVLDLADVPRPAARTVPGAAAGRSCAPRAERRHCAAMRGRRMLAP